MSDWLIFEDEVYTPADIVAKIERAVAERTGAQSQKWEQLQHISHYGALSEMPAPPEDIAYSAQLFQHLRQANQLMAQSETEPNLADSAATQIPVVGNIWRQIRKSAHQLVLFYVNRLGAEQSQVMAQLIGTINELTRQNIQLQRDVTQLRAELHEIKLAREEDER